MADSVGDQRIQVSVGAANPAAMTFAAGTAIEPFSIGKKGSWHLIAENVDEEHAFPYFDGTTLFVQSADESRPIAVNGQPVPVEWIGVPQNSIISIGEAQLWFGLSGDGDVTAPNQAPAGPEDAEPER